VTRTFDSFPDIATCPICGTNKEGECFLLPIDGTEEGDICEAQPTHTACFNFNRARYNKEQKFIYLKLD